jgi:hypothetical protein
MKNFFSGGVNATLMLFLVSAYIVLGSTDGIREFLVDLVGRFGVWLVPITVILSAKIGFNFAANRFAIPIIVGCGLAVQSAFAGILSLWQVRWILLFNPPVGNVALDYFLSMDDVHVAGGYLGRLMADTTVGILMKFPSVLAMESSEAMSWGITGLITFIAVIMCVAFWFFPSGKIKHGHSGKGHGKGRRKVVNIVN